MVNYGTTQLGTTNPPRADTHFRIASNTEDHDGRGHHAIGTGRQTESRRRGLEVCFRRARTATTSPSPSCWRCGAVSTTYTDAAEVLGANLIAIRPKLGRPTNCWRSRSSTAQRAARHDLRVQQYELRAAGTGRRKSRRQAAGDGDAGSVVQAAEHDEYHASRCPLRARSRNRSRTVICTAVLRSP